jgi:hypothetical protein
VAQSRAVVVEDADESMLVHREEIYRPVLSLKKVKNSAEALRWANDSRLGLCASIWTRDRRQARQLLKKLQAGVIMINGHLMSNGMPETPWGGYKLSCIGRYGVCCACPRISRILLEIPPGALFLESRAPFFLLEPAFMGCGARPGRPAPAGFVGRPADEGNQSIQGILAIAVL